MNKQKMILAVIGGVFGVALLVMGYLVFCAYSSKVAALSGDEEEGIDGLETVVANADQLSRKPVRPCQASVTAIESNVTAISEWREAALKQASRGDRFFDKTTAAAFKTMIVADAKRLSMLPGAVGGHVMKPDFAFGPFHDYIGGGKMPDEAALPVLQRQWDDIANVIEVLSKCGVAEVTSVALGTAVVKNEEAEASAKGKSAKKPTPKKQKVKEAAKSGQQGDVANAYIVAFSAKPDALVRVINAFATGERFVVVDDFGFTHPQDAIAQTLGGETKKTQEAPAGSRRRRRGAQTEEKKDAENESETKNKTGVVTDPATDGPLAVTLKLTVCDFRTLEENDEEKAKANGEGEGKAKEVKK